MAGTGKRGQKLERSGVSRGEERGFGGRGRKPPRSGIDFVDRHGSSIHSIATEGVRGRGAPLPHLDQIQKLFGHHDIRQVQAFTNASARRASRAIGAEAYASGSKIAFSRQPSLHTAAHEAAHVIQQRAGVHLKGGVGVIGDEYEQHADEVASRVVQGRSVESLLTEFAPSSRSQRASTSAVQGAWISRHKEKHILYRYWRQSEEDEEDMDPGWYVRTDEEEAWGRDNVTAGERDVTSTLPSGDELLPGPVDSHTSRYDPSNIEVPEHSQRVKRKIEKAALQESNLSEELEAKVREYGGKLKTSHTVYRWGEYEYEKNYVAHNGFRLGNVNFGSAQYGPGLYVASTPYGSASYATEKDGTCIQIKIPSGAFYLDYSQTKMTSKYSREHKKFKRRQVFSGSERKTIQDNSRFPQVLTIGQKSGWATIRDDRLDLEIDFYQPSPKEYAKVAPHLQKMGECAGYTAIQIINRQLGNPIHLPPKDELLSLYINQPKMKRQKLQDYIQKINKFHFVPFLLSNNGLDFDGALSEFLGTFKKPGTPRYQKYFASVEPTLRVWSKNPFALSSEDFDKVVKKPFDAALKGYSSDRERQKSQGWRQRMRMGFSKGDKEAKLGQFGRRLGEFKSFLTTVHASHSDLAGEDLDTHQGIKVGSHYGILAKGADKEVRDRVVGETMMQGVSSVGRRSTPQAIIMMGLPGSGKSTAIKKVAPDLHNYVVADPDDAKEGLPEYQEGIKSGNVAIADKVHPESKEIVGRVVEESKRSRKNVIYDTTGTGVRHTLIRDLKTAGYHVKLVYVHVSFKTAKSRVKERERSTGRGVPISVMNNVHQALRTSLYGLASMADHVYLYDNSSKTIALAWDGAGAAATTKKLRAELDKLS